MRVSADMTARNGTDVDAADAMKTFSKLGYKVTVANDQTGGQMKQLLRDGNDGCIHSFKVSMPSAYF